MFSSLTVVFFLTLNWVLIQMIPTYQYKLLTFIILQVEPSVMLTLHFWRSDFSRVVYSLPYVILLYSFV